MSELAPEIAADEAPDPAVLGAQWRLRLLEELAEISMELARALPRAAAEMAAADPASGDKGQVKACDPTEALARVSRAVRLTLAMHAKTHAELHDLKAGVVKARAQERAEVEKRVRDRIKTERGDRIDRIRELVVNVADSEHENEDDFEKVYDALDLRLEEEERIFGCPEHPLRAVVDRLCKDLGLSPDWSRWTGEGWRTEDPYSKPRFVSLKASARAAEANSPDPATPESLALQPNGHVLE